MSTGSRASGAVTRRRSRQLLAWALRLARPAVAILILAIIGYTVASKWTGTPGRPGISDVLRTLAWPSVMLSLAAVFAGTLTSLLAWRALLADEGHALSLVAAHPQVLLIAEQRHGNQGLDWIAAHSAQPLRMITLDALGTDGMRWDQLMRANLKRLQRLPR